MSSQVTTPAEPTTLSFQAQVRLHFRVCFVPTKSHSPLPFLHRRAGTRRQYTRPALHRIASPHFTSTTTGQAALRAAMAAGSSSSSWGPSPAVVKVLVALLGLGLAGYIVGPPLYWHVAEVLGGSPGACPACDCDCDALPLLSLPEDCAKQFKEVNNRVSGEETEKSFTELLIEELKQREEEATQAQQQADVKLLEAKKLASQYQKEADKCSSGMDTCEEAREKSVQALLDQKKLTALWEERAQGLGWKSGNIKPHQD